MKQKILIFSLLSFLLLDTFSPLQAQPTQESLESIAEEIIDSSENLKFSFNGYPYIFSTPEVGFAGGVGGIFIFYTSDDTEILPSKTGVSAYYSTTGQYKASINPELYLLKNRFYINTPVSFGHFVDKFWGIGNATIETGGEKYVKNVLTASIKLQIPPLWFASDRSGIIIEYDYTEIEDKKENVLLLEDQVNGSNGGSILGFGGDLVWDTRDNLFFPNSGNYQNLRLIVYPEPSDHVFAVVELDVRHYHSFEKDKVLAANIFLSAASPKTPFYKLPSLGGQHRMRGFFDGRYRDRVYLSLQLEYRQYFWRRFGFVAFAGAGDVTNELPNFELSEMKYSVGGGLRFLFNKEQKVNLRADFGYGSGGNHAIYFGIEEAF